MSDKKKVVCRSLTQAVRNSPLSGEVDPKAFFMMLSQNYDLLFHNGVLDLGPVWDALAGDKPPPMLYGLFVEFDAAAARHGFGLDQPPAVAGLTPDQRRDYHALLGGGAEAVEIEDDASPIELSDDDLFKTDPSAVAIPLTLGSQDLKPFIPEELKRDVVQIVVQSMKGAPVGAMLDSAQLAYLVNSNFEELCDGSRFDFGPILGGLRQLEGVTDEHVYVGVLALEQALAERHITLEPIELDVEPARAEALVAEAKARQKTAAREASEASARAMAEARAAEPADVPAETKPLEVPTKETAKERKLRAYGLRHLNATQLKLLRYGALVLVLVVTGTLGWVFRPDRALDTSPYAASVPLKQAELRDGVFYGVVDDRGWWARPAEERVQRVQRFEDTLKARGRLPNAQIRDASGRLVLAATGAKLSVAKFFVRGRPDGSVPDSARQPPPNAPPEARAAAAKDEEEE